MRRKNFFLSLLTGLLLSSCQVFPYVYTPTAVHTGTSSPFETPVSRISETPSSDTGQNDPTFEAPAPAIPTQTETAIIEPPILNTPTDELADEAKFQWFFPIMENAARFAFVLQEDTPLYTVNFSHPEAGCNWLGVGGQIFSETGQEITRVVVLVGGIIEGTYVEFATLSGMAPMYGPGGYEIKISEAPFDSFNAFWIEIYDLEGQAFSEKVYFDTHASCDKNLVLINFVQNENLAQPKAITPELTPTPPVHPYP